jgi:hypothetical protein
VSEICRERGRKGLHDDFENSFNSLVGLIKRSIDGDIEHIPMTV